MKRGLNGLTNRTDTSDGIYDVFRMRRWRIAIIVVAVLVIAVAGFQWYSRRAQSRRNAGYQKALQTYSARFPVGTTRKTLEDYLRANHLPFQQWSGPGTLDALSDSVGIGHDTAFVPFPCASWDTYIVFHFTSEGKRDRLKSDDSDVLKRVELQSSGDCV